MYELSVTCGKQNADSDKGAAVQFFFFFNHNYLGEKIQLKIIIIIRYI